MKIVMYGTLVYRLDALLRRKARTALEIVKFHEKPPVQDYARALAAGRPLRFVVRAAR